MTKKKPSPPEEFEAKQDALAALPPSIVHISVSLIEIAAPHTEPPESLLGQRIKHARKSLVLSVEALSRLTREYDQGGGGISPTSVARYESGEALPGLREFRLIAEALEVPVDWLLYGYVDAKPATHECTQEEIRLLHSLRDFVASAKDDAKIDNPTDTDWLQKKSRMEKLNRARKPAQKD